MIDAYAGALGVLGAFAGDPRRLERQLALIGGTSSCVVTDLPPSEVRPTACGGRITKPSCRGNGWLEGGQSTTGALLDHIVRLHSAGGDPCPAVHQRIVDRVRELRASEGQDFAARLHVLPDFHGNRSPFADPHGLGVISGLSLDATFDGLCRLYWKACVAIVLGMRHIVEKLGECGHSFETLHVTGGPPAQSAPDGALPRRHGLQGDGAEHERCGAARNGDGGGGGRRHSPGSRVRGRAHVCGRRRPRARSGATGNCTTANIAAFSLSIATATSWNGLPEGR